MATTITNVSALSDLVKFARDNGFTDETILAKVERHIEVLSKPKARKDEPSKTQLMNRSLAEQAFAVLTDLGSVTAKGLVDAMESPYVMHPQKATVLLSMLVADGRATRHSDKGKVWWTPATNA